MQQEVKLFSEPEELVEWLDENDLLMWLEVEDAQILLNYMEGHDYGIGIDADNNMVRVDIAEENGEVERYSIDELISNVCELNYELILETRERMNSPKNFHEFTKDSEKYESLIEEEKRLDEMFSKTTYAKMVSGMSKEQVEGLVNNISRHTLVNAKAFIAERNVEYKPSGKEMRKNGR